MPGKNSEIRVLVTGASGYIATHCVQQLLKQRYTVRGTVRSLDNEMKINPLLAIRDQSQAPSELFELVEADLENASDWPSAVADCTYVLHVASPFPIVSDASIVRTATEGTLNVLKAASQSSSVKKVVLTSSCVAVNEGCTDYGDQVFDETSWSNLDGPGVDDYIRSKTLAEKAAWEFWRGLPASSRFQLTVLNPTLVVGPLLMNVQGASVSIIRRFLTPFQVPLVPAIQLGVVDVRDVAKAHILSMTNPKTDGQRFLLNAKSLWFTDIAKTLADEFNSQGFWVITTRAPTFGVWLFSFVDGETSAVWHRVGKKVLFNNEKARSLIPLEFIDPAKSLVDMAYSMIERGVVPKRKVDGSKLSAYKETNAVECSSKSLSNGYAK